MKVVQASVLEQLDKQREFYAACADPNSEIVVFDGSIGLGKTQAAGAVIFAWALNYGGTYAVIRKTYRELADSTQKVMVRGDGGLPPSIPPEFADLQLVDERARDELCRIYDPSSGKLKAEILFRSAEEPKMMAEKFKNITLSGFFIDQVEELEEDGYEESFDILLGRLRSPAGPNKGICASNPNRETLWQYRRLVDPATRDEGVRYVHGILTDNPTLPKQYVERMLKTEFTRPDYFQRFIMGVWGSFGGKRFKMWNTKRHVIDPFDAPPDWEFTDGIDYGWDNPTVCVNHATATDGHQFIIGEHAASMLRIAVHTDQIKRNHRLLGISPSTMWLDPSAWATKAGEDSPALQFAAHGLYVAKANNERLSGWDRIEELLSERVDQCSCRDRWGVALDLHNTPRLLVLRDRAPMLVKQLPNLKIQDGTDDVEKKHDHAPDALRYIVSSRPHTPRQTVVEEESDLRSAYAQRIVQRRIGKGKRQGLVFS